MRQLPRVLTSFCVLVWLVSGCGTSDQQPLVERQTADPVSVDDLGADSPISEGAQSFSLSDFSIFPDDDDSWTEGETITCAGKTKGYIFTNAAFGDGTVSFEYRFPADLPEDVIPNTGLLLLIEPPHRKWPRCIEAQGKQSEAGELKGNGGVDGLEVVLNNFEADAPSPIHPPGEWNHVEVVVSNGTVTTSWNGQQTAKCGFGGLTAGPFGLQSEGNPVEFRNIVFTPAD